jgi:hypothetical protein
VAVEHGALYFPFGFFVIVLIGWLLEVNAIEGVEKKECR